MTTLHAAKDKAGHWYLWLQTDDGRLPVLYGPYPDLAQLTRDAHELADDIDPAEVFPGVYIEHDRIITPPAPRRPLSV